MSEENVEIVRRAYETGDDAYYGRIEALHEAHESGDFAEFLPATDELVNADFVLRTPEGGLFPEGGTTEWRGREGFIRFVAQQAEAFESMWIEPEEFIDAGNKVVVPLQFGGRARSTGIEVKFALVHVVTIHDRKAARIDIYVTKTEALEAAGLSE
jgi:ketosteroid isomerase-like protein